MLTIAFAFLARRVRGVTMSALNRVCGGAQPWSPHWRQASAACRFHRYAIRSVRRDAINALKDALKAKTISEDEERGAQDVVQKMTDKTISEVDKMFAAKETELMAL